MPVKETLFFFIGDHAYTMEELGDIADMPFDKGLQEIIDRGLLGEEYKGKAWFDVIKPSGMSLEGEPPEEEVLLRSLYKVYKESLDRCKALADKGELTQVDKDEMLQLRKDWRAATKLSTD